jgi:hypothetical protein
MVSYKSRRAGGAQARVQLQREAKQNEDWCFGAPLISFLYVGLLCTCCDVLGRVGS